MSQHLPDFHMLQRWAGMLSDEAERRHATATAISMPAMAASFANATAQLNASRHQDTLGDEFDKLAAFMDWLAGRANKLHTLGVADPIARHDRRENARA